MISKYLIIYKKIFSSKLLLKNMPIHTKTFLFIIFGITITTIFSDKLFNPSLITKNIIFIILIISQILIFLKGYKKTIKNVFGFDSIEELSRHRKSQFLKECNIHQLDNEQLKKLIDYIKDYSKGMKTNYFIKAGSIYTVFIVIFTSLINTIFEKYTTSIIELILITIAIFSLILFIIVIAANIKIIVDDLNNKEYNILLDIIYILKEDYISRSLNNKKITLNLLSNKYDQVNSNN